MSQDLFVARPVVRKAGTTIGTRPAINFIEGSNITLTVADDSGNGEVDVTVAAASAAMAIGGTVTSGTQGSVLFVGASAALTQDNTNLFWDDANNRLGLGGVTSPSTTLHLQTPNAVTGGVMMQTNATDSSAQNARFKVRHYLTAEEPVTIIYADALSATNVINFGGGSGAENAATSIRFYTATTSTTLTGTSTLTIDNTLDVSADAGSFVVPTAGKSFRGHNGTASAPLHSFSALTSYGMWAAANQLSLSVAGTESLRLDNSTGLRLVNSETDATNKAMRLVLGHYTNSEEPLGLIMGNSTVNAGQVFIGGGSSLLNAATQLSFYTAADSITTTGTERLRIVSGGTVGAAVGFFAGSLTTAVNTGEVRGSRNARFGSITTMPFTEAAGDAVFGQEAASCFAYDQSAGHIYNRQGTTNMLVPMVINTQTATVTHANSTTETTLTGASQGTLTLPANYLIVGRTVRITAFGVYGTDAITPGTLTIAVKFGATTVLTTGALTMTAALTAQVWKLEAEITCQTTGSTGTVIAQGMFQFHIGTTVANSGQMTNGAGGITTVTINTTTTQAIDITADWSVADADNTISCTNLAIEGLSGID